MKNSFDCRKNSGITLITLVITIIVLLILASIATYSGIEAIEHSKITAFTAELKIMQLNVNDLYEKYKNEQKVKLDNELKSILELGEQISNTEQNEYYNSLTEDNKTDYRYFSNSLIKKLGIEGVEQDFLINIKKRKVISYKGLKYENKMYYTLDELPEGFYNVDNVYEPISKPDINGNEVYRGNGTVDIQFLTGTTYNIGQANKPQIDIKNMIPVNWQEGEDGSEGYWVVADENDWKYSYDETNKSWANVMLKDALQVEGIQDAKTATIAEMKGKTVTKEGSMLVWIPRYAYKIIYYDENDTNKTGTPVGYSDARGIVDAEGKTPKGMKEPVTSISVGDYYRPHPAFEDGSKLRICSRGMETKYRRNMDGKI